MARAHLRFVFITGGRAVQNASVDVYEVGTTTPVDTADMFTTRTGGTNATNPLFTNNQGEIEAWLTDAQTVDLRITDNSDAAYYVGTSTTLSWTPFTETVEVHVAPEDDTGGGGGGATDLPDLTDVDDAAAPTSGHYLRGDGTEWSNSLILEADIPADIARDSEVSTAVSDHSADTTSVHGIADTSVLATDIDVATAVSDHSADTTSVHGIADTSALETTTGAQTKVDTHVNDTTAAHAATAIEFTPAGSIAATNVQDAIEEVALEGGGGGGASTLPDLTDVDDTAAPTSGHYLRGDGTDWSNSAILEADIPSTIARDSEVTTAITNHEAAADPHTVYQKESEKGAASGYASLDGSTKVPIAEIPTGTTSSTVSLGNHTHTESIVLAFSKAGALTTATGKHRLYAPGGVTWTIAEVRASVGTAPTGASLIVDVHKSGTTIFTTQSNRPTVAASGFTDLADAVEVPSLASGEYLTVDVDQIGSSVAGEDLTVQVLLTRAI